MRTVLAVCCALLLAVPALADQPPHNPQPGPDPPKCAPPSTPGCSDNFPGEDPDEAGGDHD
jgi:hypothetical protein